MDRLGKPYSNKNLPDGFTRGNLVVIDGVARCRPQQHIRNKKLRRRGVYEVLCLCKLCNQPRLIKVDHLRSTTKNKSCGCIYEKKALDNTSGLHPTFELIKACRKLGSGGRNVLHWKIRCRRCAYTREEEASKLKNKPCSACKHLYEFRGQLLTRKEITKRTGLSKHVFLRRMRQHGMSANEATAFPCKRRPHKIDGRLWTARELGKKLGVHRVTITRRLNSGLKTLKELGEVKKRSFRDGDVFGQLTIIKARAKKSRPTDTYWKHLVKCGGCSKRLYVSWYVLRTGSCTECKVKR